MNQINEALAWWDDNRAHVWQRAENGQWAQLDRIANAARAYVRGWVTCPTCKGRELDIPLPVELTEPCPDCVDGMIPSPEAERRVATVLADHDTVLVEDAPEIYLPLARRVLLASRREGD